MATAPRKLEKLAAQLESLSETLAQEEAFDLPASRAKRVHQTIAEAYEKLRKVMDGLDPIKHPGFVFDPSNPDVVARIVGIAMLAQPRKPLAKVERFYGSGVYAIYYQGSFLPYAPISKQEHPIYIGKADPSDSQSRTVMEQGEKLAVRLNEHRKNIARAATTLRVDDFEYRALAVLSGGQHGAEQYLIRLFHPIWNNKICYGFGKHGDDPKTRANQRSPWDTLHPGRSWAHRDPGMKDARTETHIVEEIAQHFRKHPLMGSINEILLRFLAEMRRGGS